MSFCYLKEQRQQQQTQITTTTSNNFDVEPIKGNECRRRYQRQCYEEATTIKCNEHLRYFIVDDGEEETTLISIPEKKQLKQQQPQQQEQLGHSKLHSNQVCVIDKEKSINSMDEEQGTSKVKIIEESDAAFATIENCLKVKMKNATNQNENQNLSKINEISFKSPMIPVIITTTETVTKPFQLPSSSLILMWPLVSSTVDSLKHTFFSQFLQIHMTQQQQKQQSPSFTANETANLIQNGKAENRYTKLSLTELRQSFFKPTTITHKDNNCNNNNNNNNNTNNCCESRKNNIYRNHNLNRKTTTAPQSQSPSPSPPLQPLSPPTPPPPSPPPKTTATGTTITTLTTTTTTAEMLKKFNSLALVTAKATQRRQSRLRTFLVAILLFFMIFNFHTKPVAAADSLLGDLQSCSEEGEEIQIPGIKNSKCFKCVCQNGFVNCDQPVCPSIDDCYLLDTKSSDACCKRCKGCTFRGVAYPSGAEWTDPDEPCKTYKCIASVVTETIMKCYTQCDDDQLIPAGPGECCPKCQGCKINGQIISEGQEVVGSIDDRCLVCQCTGNKLKCAKKTCPILQCPISKQRQDPNECCPRCTEHRQFMPVIGKCMFSNNVFYDKTQFTPDRCTNCTCTNGTSICQRNTCPILECSPEYQEMDGCCPRCVVSEVRSECIYNGITYQNNETWNLGPCRSCRCTAGNIRCSEMRCPAVKCRANEEHKILPGECCPKCIETAGTCTVFGDPHFRTFDGKFFSFQGSCKYLLTEDCHDHTFSIRLTNDGRGTKRSSWPKTVTFKMKGGVRVNLGQKLRVKVNGSRVILPYSEGPIVSIERLPEGYVLLKTDLGISIEWDGNNFLQVRVPATYKRRLCGLCGNFNGIGRDDLTSRDGTNHSENEVWRFANSWKVGGPKACSRQAEKPAFQPVCKRRRSNELCQPLRQSDVFGNCDTRLNPFNYIESCKMDVCECTHSMCHCDSFAAYAHECRRLGVHLPDWRNMTNCPAGYWRRNMTIAAATSSSKALSTTKSKSHAINKNRLYSDATGLQAQLHTGTLTGAATAPGDQLQKQERRHHHSARRQHNKWRRKLLQQHQKHLQQQLSQQQQQQQQQQKHKQKQQKNLNKNAQEDDVDMMSSDFQLHQNDLMQQKDFYIKHVPKSFLPKLSQTQINRTPLPLV